MNVTDQQIQDTEVSLSHWWCGTDFGSMTEDGVEFTDDAITGARLLDEFEYDTVKLLTMWRGYLHAALEESEVEPTVEDFVLATYIVQQED